ncbi:hypothetical protein [Shewanella sp. UCD-KL12]|uniref:hypothetical protein n=1 Tax=Shewanella sp. UCD-KL12 TaxID=1917163 RepID=UPI000970807C|nr:hypothetical protein [Shewanella sp. UCD-KL12]
MTIVYDNQITVEEASSTHDVLCSDQSFDGIRYTRLPISLLLDFVSNQKKYSAIQYHLGKLELARRDFVDCSRKSFEVEVSHHAIDRLSTVHLHRYLGNNLEGQGIVCWLKQQVIECLDVLDINDIEKINGMTISHNGMRMKFVQHSKIVDRLVLSTLM